MRQKTFSIIKHRFFQVIITGLLALSSVGSLKAQEVVSIVDADTLTPGDIVTYTLVTKKTSDNQQTVVPDSSAFGEDFEIRSSSMYKPDVYTDSLVMELQYFGVGANQIPGFDLPITDGNDTTFKSLSPVPLSYKTLVEDPENAPLQPLKDIFEFAIEWWLYLLLALAVILIGYFLYRWGKSRDAEETHEPEVFTPTPFVNPIAQLSKGLTEVSESDALNSDDFKSFYSELGDVIRTYFEDAYNIDALEMTTRELMRELNTKAVDDELIQHANAILRQADMVKFARFVPSLESAYKDLDKGKGFLEKVKRIDGPRIESLKRRHERMEEEARQLFEEKQQQQQQQQNQEDKQ
jgi:hypothetical protein